METAREFPTKLGDGPARSSFPSPIEIVCHNLQLLVLNRTGIADRQQALPKYILRLLATKNLTTHVFNSAAECTIALARQVNDTNELRPLTSDHPDNLHMGKYSNSLLTFVALIGLVSIISIIGNLCLTKVIYAKRLRLIQTDRIVLCLALSKSMACGRSLPARYLLLRLLR
jgi:hypothetical protein